MTESPNRRYSDIPDLLEAHSEADAEIVIGNRFGRSSETEMPLYRRFGLSVITVLANLSMGRFTPSARIQDTQSGFRSYDGTAVEELAANTDVIDNRMGASVDILSFANAKGFTTAEVPTTITYDVSNASTRNPLAHGLEIVGNIFGTVKRTRPVTVFGVPGVVMFITGVGLNHWTGSSGSASLGVTLLSALLVLVGVLSSFLSVVQYSLTGARDTML